MNDGDERPKRRVHDLRSLAIGAALFFGGFAVLAGGVSLINGLTAAPPVDSPAPPVDSPVSPSAWPSPLPPMGVPAPVAASGAATPAPALPRREVRAAPKDFGPSEPSHGMVARYHAAGVTIPCRPAPGAALRDDQARRSTPAPVARPDTQRALLIPVGRPELDPRASSQASLLVNPGAVATPPADAGIAQSRF